MDIDFLAARHRVFLPQKVKQRTLLAQCQYIAKYSQIMKNCEAYWLFVSLVTWMKSPRTCPVFQELDLVFQVFALSILMDFDETTVFTEAFEHRFDIVEQLFNVFVERPTLIPGGKVDNLGIYQSIARSLGLPVEAVIMLHTLEWDSRMEFRPGVIDYLRQEASLKRVQIVSSSYPEVVASRLYSQGHNVVWSEDLTFAFWKLPEGDIRIVGRHTDANWAKPHPAIPNRAIELSGLQTSRQVSYEDSMSGVNAAQAANVPLRIGVGERNLDGVQTRIQNFVGFTPASLDALWNQYIG